MTERHISKILSALALAAAFVLAGGCGAGDAPEEAAQPPAETMPAAEPAVVAPTGAIDAQMADQGESLFQTKGCVGCHTVGGGQLAGPDLAGVTTRREFDWFIAMVINPDSMLQNDDTAQELFEEYMTPMMNMGVNRAEAAAIFEYLRQESQ